MGNRGRERERESRAVGREREEEEEINKYNVLIDQSNAQSFLDNHMG